MSDAEYRYGMRLRGCSIGCQPNDGLLYREDDDTGEYYDILVYDRPLTEDEISHYSLDFISGGEEMAEQNISTELELVNSVVIDENYIDNLMKGENEMENAPVITKENENMETEVTVMEDGKLDIRELDVEPITLDKNNQTYTVENIVKNINNGKFTFENTVQRTNVWTRDQQSLLIDSLIHKMPVPALYARNAEGGVRDFLDGKQRCEAMRAYLGDEFELQNIPIVEVKGENENGEPLGVDINGYKFSELPKSIQNAIKSATLTVFSYANDDGTFLDDEQTADVFYRMNNGTSLTKIEITRVKAKCYNLIKQIASHEIFTEAMTAKSLLKYSNEDTVMKGLMLLLQDEPCLDNKAVRPFIENVEIEEDDVSRLNDIFDVILDAHTAMKQDAEKLDGKDKAFALKVAKRIYTRTHMISIIPIVDRAIYEDKDSTDMAGFFKYFFGDKKYTTISKEYNNSTTDGANHTPKVLRRLHAIEKAYEEYFGKATTNDDDAELSA